jgi:hypothetical protein
LKKKPVSPGHHQTFENHRGLVKMKQSFQGHLYEEGNYSQTIVGGGYFKTITFNNKGTRPSI